MPLGSEVEEVFRARWKKSPRYAFYEIEDFKNRNDFMAKATVYQHFFNLHRPNSYKENKTPWQLTQEKRPDLDKHLLMIPPVDLDRLFRWKTLIIQAGGKDQLTVP